VGEEKKRERKLEEAKWGKTVKLGFIGRGSSSTIDKQRLRKWKIKGNTGEKQVK
jgi:hypothetical protein